MLAARVGTMPTLDASATPDPDSQRFDHSWFFYPEAGSGIPNAGGRGRGAGGGGGAGAGAAGRGGPGARGGGPAVQSEIPPAPPGGRPVPIPRVTVFNENSFRASVMPNTPGVAHVILAVTDSGSPALTSYRRVILNIQPAVQPQ